MQIKTKSLFRKFKDSIIGIFPIRAPLKRSRNVSEGDIFPTNGNLSLDQREIKKVKLDHEPLNLPTLKNSLKSLYQYEDHSFKKPQSNTSNKCTGLSRKLGYFEDDITMLVSKGTDTSDLNDDSLLDFQFRPAATIYDDLEEIKANFILNTKKFVFKSMINNEESSHSENTKGSQKLSRLWRCNTCFQENRESDVLCKGCSNLSSLNEDDLILGDITENLAYNYGVPLENIISQSSDSLMSTLPTSVSLCGNQHVNSNVEVIDNKNQFSEINKPESISFGISSTKASFPVVSSSNSLSFGTPPTSSGIVSFSIGCTPNTQVDTLSSQSVPFAKLPISAGVPSFSLQNFSIPPPSTPIISTLQSTQFEISSTPLSAPQMSFGIPSTVSFTFKAPTNDQIQPTLVFGAPSSQPSSFNFALTSNAPLGSAVPFGSSPSLTTPLPQFSTSLNSEFSFGASQNNPLAVASNPFSGSTSVPGSMDRLTGQRKMANRRRAGRR